MKTGRSVQEESGGSLSEEFDRSVSESNENVYEYEYGRSA
jgi:hypothetical protein